MTMNLVRRARILNILLAHMTQAADEIERVLFERDPDWTRRQPSPSPANAPAGFAQAAAEEHLRALASEGYDADEVARDYLAQPDAPPNTPDAFERAIQAHREQDAKLQQHPSPQDPPRPNPDNVWGAVHKLRDRFGNEAAQILVDALSREMEGRMDAAAQAQCVKAEHEKWQRDQERDRITERVLNDLEALERNYKEAIKHVWYAFGKDLAKG